MRFKNIKFPSFILSGIMVFTLGYNTVYAETSGGVEIPTETETFICSICEEEKGLSEDTIKDIVDYNGTVYDFVCTNCYNEYYNEYISSIVKDVPTKWETDWEDIKTYDGQQLEEFYNTFENSKDYIIFEQLIKNEELNTINKISATKDLIEDLENLNKEKETEIESSNAVIVEENNKIEDAKKIIELNKDAEEGTPEYEALLEAEQVIIDAEAKIVAEEEKIYSNEQLIILNNEMISQKENEIVSLNAITENCKSISENAYTYLIGDLQIDYFKRTFNVEWLTNNSETGTADNGILGYAFFAYLSENIKNEEDSNNFKIYLNTLDEYNTLTTEDKNTVENLIAEAFREKLTYEDIINVEIPEKWKDLWSVDLFLKKTDGSEIAFYEFVKTQFDLITPPDATNSTEVEIYNKKIIDLSDLIDALIKKTRDELVSSGADTTLYALDSSDISAYQAHLYEYKKSYQKEYLYIPPEVETTTGSTVKPEANAQDQSTIPNSTYKASDFTLSTKSYNYVRGWLDPGYAKRSEWAKCHHTSFSDAERCYLDENYPWYNKNIYEEVWVTKQEVKVVPSPSGIPRPTLVTVRVKETQLVRVDRVRDKYSATEDEVAKDGHVWDTGSNGLHIGVNAREIFRAQDPEKLFVYGRTNVNKIIIANGREITYGSSGTLTDDNAYQGDYRVISRSGAWYKCYYTVRTSSTIDINSTCYILTGEPTYTNCSYSEDSYAPNGIETKVIQGNNYLNGKTSPNKYTTEDSNLVVYVVAKDQLAESDKNHSGINHFEAHITQYNKDNTKVNETPIVFSTSQPSYNNTKHNYAKEGAVSAVFSMKPTGICQVVIYAVDGAGNYSGKLFDSGKMYIDRAAPEAKSENNVPYNTRILKDRTTYGLAEAVDIKINFRDKLEEKTHINNGKNESVSAGSKYSGYKNIYALVTNVDILDPSMSAEERALAIKALFRDNTAVGNISDISKSEKIVYTVPDENVKIKSAADAKKYQIIPYVKSDGTTTKPYSVSNEKTNNVNQEGSTATDNTTVGNAIYMSNFLLEETGNYYIYWCAIDYADNWVCNKEGLYVVAGVVDAKNEIEFIPNPTDGTKNYTIEKGSSGTLKIVMKGLNEDQVNGNPAKGIGRAYVAINFPKWTADYEYLEKDNAYTYTSGYYINDVDFANMTYGTFDPNTGKWIEGVIKYDIDTYDNITGKSLVLKRDEALDNHQDGEYVYYHNFIVPMGVEVGSTYDVDIKLITPEYGVDPVSATQVYSLKFTVTDTENMSTYEVNTGND